MPASYPTSAKSFTTKSDGPGNTILAAYVNDLQAEVTAVETDLINGLPVARGGTGLTAIGAADTVLTSNGSVASWAASANEKPCQGRLSLTTGVPVTTADVTAAGTLYWVPYKGNQLALYSGSAWVMFSQAQLSIAVPAVANQVYDVFIDYNGGTPALSLTAWTNDTTRATALTTQDGVYVLTGSTGKRYVGTVRTVTASQLNDSVLLRHVWNYYHRARRPVERAETAASWNYTTATIRQANASALNQISIVVGVAEQSIDLSLQTLASNSSIDVGFSAGIGYDSTTSFLGLYSSGTSQVANLAISTFARLDHIPAAGFHFYSWNEVSVATGTTTWLGARATAPHRSSGLIGLWDS